MSYEILKVIPRRGDQWTQGFEWVQGMLWEGTGRIGKSGIYRFDPVSGEYQTLRTLEPSYYGEGITILNGKLYQITWREEKAFQYDFPSIKREKTFDYKGQGWGLTNDGKQLIMSNGTYELVWRDPKTFKVLRKKEIFLANQRLNALNELEHVKGSVYANVFQTPSIVKIDLESGCVRGVLDLRPLVKKNPEEVLNGIAYDAQSETFYVTGKLWKRVYQMRIF